MQNAIEIKNLSYKNIYKNFNMKIKENAFLSIIGTNENEINYLIKIISGNCKYDGEIIINDRNLQNDKRQIKKEMGIIYCDSTMPFEDDTVYNNLYLINKNNPNIKEIIEKISTTLDIYDLLNKKYKILSSGEKQKVILMNELIRSPKILILNNALSMVDDFAKEKIYLYLQRFNKKMTIINITNNIEDTLYSKSIAVISNGKLICNNKKEIVYQIEEIFTEFNLNPPFIIELSKKLSYYNLINKQYNNEIELVENLW